MPGNFTVTILNNSIANLQWRHPWKTGNFLKQFRIEIRTVSTNLQNFHKEGDSWPLLNVISAVTNYTSYYNKQLYLLPSTRYSIGIQAQTYTTKLSKMVHATFETPSMLKFNGSLNYEFYESSSMAVLSIPAVANNTKNSSIHVIIKGRRGRFCENTQIPRIYECELG